MTLKNSSNDVVVGAVALVAFWCFFAIDKILFLHNADFRGFLMGQIRSQAAAQYLPGAAGDFLRSLGISEYPGSLILDLPWLLATHVPTEYLQIVYGLTTYMSLYLAINLLGKKCAVDPIVRQIAGFLLPLLMAFPSTISWNLYSLYSSSFSWMVVSLTLGLLAVDQAKQKSRGASFIIGLVTGCVIFLANVHYLPMTLPVIVIGASTIYFLTNVSEHKRLLRLTFSGMGVGLLLSLPIFLGTYLFGVWAIPDVAVQENIDRLSWVNLPKYLLPFPAIGNLPLVSQVIPSAFVQLLMTAVIIAAGGLAFRQGKRVLALFGVAAMVLYFLQATLYGVAAIALRRELGVDPHYTEIIAYPLWILLVTNFAVSGLALIVPRRILFKAILPVLLITGWTTQWGIRNEYQRLAPPEYPIRLSSVAQHLTALVVQDHLEGSFSRTIIIQSQKPVDRGGEEGYRIRRADAFTETFLLELTYARVPVLNAYTHLISPRAFSMTNRLFGDGRPAWRQFSSYDVANVEAMPGLGIRYVLSEEPLASPGLQLISSEPYLAYGLFPAPDMAYLYEVVDTRLDPRIMKYEFKDDRMRVLGYSSSPATVTVPIEFSNCLHANPTSSSSKVAMGRNDIGLMTLSFTGMLDVEIDYDNSLFQLKNCRLLDYFDFRSERQSDS